MSAGQGAVGAASARAAPAANGRPDGAAGIADYMRRRGSIPGWFPALDADVFTMVDAIQRAGATCGDLLEIGVYQGLSAVLLGYLVRPDEELVVCDVFDEPVDASANRAENAASYPGLTRARFEAHYLDFHRRLPSVLQCSSTELPRLLAGRAMRFVHVDGSHLYDLVRADLETARALLVRGGVVAVDDYRHEHTPGVAAAVWAQVATGGLTPLLATRDKLYATWTPEAFDRDALATLVAARPETVVDTQDVAGHELLCVAKAPAAPRLSARVARAIVPPAVLGLRARVGRASSRA
jgi:hypothetical protein